VFTAKVPSTRGDQSRALSKALPEGRDFCRHFRTVVHGTTVGTNALLERKGARTGIITTDGLSRRAGNAPPRSTDDVGAAGAFTPVVDRPNRVEVAERVLADGSVLRASTPRQRSRRAPRTRRRRV
jgi:N-methylhydantoinase A